MSTSPYLFSFDSSYITTAGHLERGLFSKGGGFGIDNPNAYSASAPYQTISTAGGVDVVAMTLVAGQTYVFDIDNGTGGASYIDLELDIINQAGTLVRNVDDTSSGRDPFVTFTPTVSGLYYVAVHQAGNDYINGSFNWERTGSDTGDYTLNVSTQFLPPVYTLTAYGDTRSYSDAAQTVRALGGNDVISLGGGNDIGIGGEGADRIYGGLGIDEISGNAGADRLYGESGNDVLVGGGGNDLAWGGYGNDFVWGDAGNDYLSGEAGNDVIRGGFGVDTLYGNAGADSFHFMPGEANADLYGTNEDRIQDFYYDDVIDLTDMAWGQLTWRGNFGFTGTNQVRVVDVGSGYQAVHINLSGTAAPEQTILVKAGFDLTQYDFNL